MKYLVVLLLLSIPGWAAYTLDGHINQDNGSSNSTTVVISNLTKTAGDLITCEVSFGGGSTFTSVADSLNAGNYTAAVPVHNNATMDQQIGIYYKENTLATGALNITLTYSPTNSFSAMQCQTWTGGPTSGSLDLHPAVNDSSGVNPALAANSTPAVNGELVIAVVNMHSVTPTAGTNYTLIDSATSTLMFSQRWIQTTATATNGAFSAATDTAWSIAVASFEPAAPPPSAPTMPPAVY